MSATHKVFGASGWNWRSTRSPGRSATGPGTVVRGALARGTPRNLSARIKRSTVHRAVS
jgi:hypothetical protein